MNNLTVVVPFYQGHETLQRLVRSLPEELPIILVDDMSEPPLQREVWMGENINIIRMESKGYFAGAVNKGLSACKTDVLVLNQDVWFENDKWLDLLTQRDRYAMIGEKIRGEHPAFGTFGYIHGVFMFLRRDAVERVGLLNQTDYPLWGNTAEWQWRARRKGFEVLPTTIPGLYHERPKEERFGSSIKGLLQDKPEMSARLIQTPPLLSVIVPCYNYGRYLNDCINSLIGGPTSLGEAAGQTLQSFEVIVVDDASTDETPEIMSELCDLTKGIRGYRLDTNQGTAHTLNYGIERAVGQFITFLSADDMREPWSLEALVRSCQAHPHSFAYDDVWLFFHNKRVKQWSMEDYDFESLIYKNQVHAGIVYPKQAWQEVGGYPGIMNDGREDWAFNVALGVHGWCGEHIRQYGYLYRRENQNRSLTNTSPNHYDKFLQKISGLFPEIYRGERPMACCGKGRTQPSRSVTRSSQQPATGMRRSMTVNGASGGAMATPENTKGMVRLVYTGKAMTSVWDGAFTNTRYRFGADRPKGWVYRADAGEQGRSGFLNVTDNKGNYLFTEDRLGELPVEVSKTVTPPPAAATHKVKVSKADAQAEPVVVVTAVKEEAGSPDPNGLNAAEVRSLVLSKEQWEQVYKAELAGKNRKSVITFIEEQLGAEPVG